VARVTTARYSFSHVVLTSMASSLRQPAAYIIARNGVAFHLPVQHDGGARIGPSQANSARARSEMAITAGLRSFLSTVIA
jgi:hypothetical protein